MTLIPIILASLLTFIALVTLVLVVYYSYASSNINSGAFVKALCKNAEKGRVIALTFDDGPDPIQTPKVLDVLKKHNIKACFFCIGSKINGNEALMQRMVDEGHLTGNHSFSHLFSFPLHTSNWIKRDLLACDMLLPNNQNRLFRPPFGVTNPMIGKAVRSLGYTTIGWNIRSLDTCRSNEKVLNRIRKRLTDGSVILLHDRLPESDILLEEVIKLIKQENYKIVGIDELFDLDTDNETIIYDNLIL